MTDAPGRLLVVYVTPFDRVFRLTLLEVLTTGVSRRKGERPGPH